MPLQTGIFTELLADQNALNAAALAEQRSSLENPSTPLSMPAEWLLDLWGGVATDAGVRVNEHTAFQIATFLACVDLISGSVASLPRHVFERSFLSSGRAVHKISYDHDLEDIVSLEPNDEMSAFVFGKAQMVHALGWGNSYGEIQRDSANRIIGIWPRNPDKTRPHRLNAPLHLEPVPWRPFPVSLKAGELCYKTTDGLDETGTGTDRFIPKEDMFHIPGLSFDGRLGQSVVLLSRQLLGMALATDKYGARYFANFARPSGILEVPPGLTDPQLNQAKDTWQKAQSGDNAHKIATLKAGFKFTKISNSPQESETTAIQGFLRNQVCSIFHVPPHMVGDVDKGRANTEQLAQEYVTYTLAPWLEAIRQEGKRKFFPNSGIGRTPKSRFYIDFDLWKMVRPDSASRERFYATSRNIAGICSNDFREYEGMNPIDEPWAEKFWMPINMTLVETPLDPTNQDGSGNGAPATDASKGDKASNSLARHYFRLFRDAFGRILSRQKPTNADFQQAFGPVLWSLADLFAEEQRGKYGAQTERFVAEFIGGMHKRAKEWENTDECARRELVRGIKAVRVAVYRDIAEQKAMKVDDPAPPDAEETNV